jgi:hypothetical protein
VQGCGGEGGERRRGHPADDRKLLLATMI